MQIIINIVLIIVILYIILKIFQIQKLYDAFDIIIIKFIKTVSDLNTDNKKAIDIIAKLVDKMNKGVYKLSYIQKGVDDLQKIDMSFNVLNTNLNENINTNARVFKEATNIIRSKILDLNLKTNKLSSIINKLDNIENRFETIEKKLNKVK